jgi:ABC-type glutathione transport system ATPase component
MRIEQQVAEVLLAHRQGRGGRREWMRRTREILQQAGLGDERRRRAFPHELSGGERQRAALAQALVCRPKLLIADEPTSSLDTITQAAVLALLRDLVHSYASALVLISHDPAVVRFLADRVLVMESGRVVEQGSAEEVFSRPAHPFTRELVLAAPALAGPAAPPWNTP